MKKLLPVLLSVLLIASFSISVSASGTQSYTGALEYDETVANANRNLTDEEIQKLNEKLAMQFQTSETQNVTRETTWVDVPGTFVLYFQTTSYNCGPACVQSAINYLSESDLSQSTVAEGCQTTTNGTYLSNMVPYLNDHQNQNLYVEAYNKTQSVFADNLFRAIDYYDSPGIVGFACTEGGVWQYSTDGHFVCINSARSDQGAFQLADPLIGYLGLSVHFYRMPVADLYNAYNSVNIGYCW